MLSISAQKKKDSNKVKLIYSEIRAKSILSFVAFSSGQLHFLLGGVFTALCLPEAVIFCFRV